MKMGGVTQLEIDQLTERPQQILCTGVAVGLDKIGIHVQVSSRQLVYNHPDMLQSVAFAQADELGVGESLHTDLKIEPQRRSG